MEIKSRRFFIDVQPPVGGGGGGGGEGNLVGVCGLLSKTLTLFETKVCDFRYPIYDLTKDIVKGF